MGRCGSRKRMIGEVFGRGVRGFTLVELLVVIGIIGLLIALSLVVGSKVVGGSKERFTADTLRILDSALANYIQDQGSIPAAYVDEPGGGRAAVRRFGIADAHTQSGGPWIDSTALFMLQMQGTASAKAALDKLPARAVRQDQVAGYPIMTTAVDAWGNTIRYVHPAFDGFVMPPQTLVSMFGAPPTGMSYFPQAVYRPASQVDGGLCPNNRPYFYSSGPDGKPETKDDNVYLVKPQFMATR